MVADIELSVDLSDQTVEIFKRLGLNLPSEGFMQDYEFRAVDSTMVIEDVAYWIEQYLELLYKRKVEGRSQIQVQVQAVWHSKSKQKLPFQDEVTQHLKPNDSVLIAAMALGPVSAGFDIGSVRPRFTNQDIEDLRKILRFGLNDRVLCYCGPRWLSGWIVGTGVVDDEDLFPYLVKTDPLPGLPTNTISVPRDSNEMCIQEVCFDPVSQLHLVKAAAAMVLDSKKPKLRFAVGDKVVCRIRNNPTDALEEWVSGSVSELWPKLGGEQKWDMGEVTGDYPSIVPYKIELVSGWVYCHKDDHTLIRRDGFQPVARVKGMSKRMELRENADGSKERIDHVTERRKRLMNTLPSDSE